MTTVCRFRYRVAMLGARNATPVSGTFHTLADARRWRAQHAHHYERPLVIKCYYATRLIPVRGWCEPTGDACESDRTSCAAEAGAVS